MSDSSFPFEGQTMTQALVPDIAPSDGGTRAKLLVLGALAAVLVLGLVAYFLVFSGGGEDEDAAAAPRPVAAAPAPAAEAPAAAKPAKKERISAKSFGRDPFKPLIVEAVAAEATTVPVTGAVTGGTTPGGTTAGSAPQPGTTTPSTSTSHSFRVVDVAPDNSTITVKVDGKVYRNLKAGEVFAEFFKVRLISGQVNSFQFGDEKFNVIGTKKLTIA